jgi:NarL family two-component system response regulator LiaR
MRLNKPIQIILASMSKLFLEGIHKVLAHETDVRIVAHASKQEEIKKYLTEVKAEVLFLDYRTLKVDIHELLDVIVQESPDTKIILLDSYVENQVGYSNIISITKETTLSELIQIIKESQTKKVKHVNQRRNKLTNIELKIVELIGDGFSNKEIAKKFSIKEKTVKSHLTHIFKKLGLQSRYQLLLYAKQLRHKTK